MYLPLALALADERAREAARMADRRALAELAGHVRAHGNPSGTPRQPGRARTFIARPIRAFGDASHALSEAACRVATRIEGATG